MDSSISLRNRQRKVRVDAGRLEEFTRAAVRLCSAAAGRRQLPQEIAIILVSDRRIASLHAEFMNIEGPTDVLTFQHGEIVVSAETARRNARIFKATTEAEIRLYIVHGLVHLRGFDDRTARGAREMDALQKKILLAAAPRSKTPRRAAAV